MEMDLSNLSMPINSSEAFTIECDNITSISPSLHQNKLIPTIYSVIFVLGFVGNVLVVCVLCQKSNRKTVANTYMLNLALSDLLFLCGLPFFAVYYSYDYIWVFGSFMCKLCGSLLSLNVYASIYFITCMSVDRYRAIVYPLRSQSSRNIQQARVISCVIWVFAGLTTIPSMVFRDTRYIPELRANVCGLFYPADYWLPGMALTKNIVAFLVPFTIIASCYCRIGVHLLGAPRLDKSSNNVDRVMKMVVAVVLAFFICWFPFQLLTFLNALVELNVLGKCWDRPGSIKTLMPFSLCLGFSNSAINPFLYCFVGNHFRGQLWRVCEEKVPRLSQKRDSISTRFSQFSFSRKMSDLKDTGPLETLREHRAP